MQYELDGFLGMGICTWPNYNHKKYSEWQWERKGYLKKVKRKTKCECGSEAVYGERTNLHSFWCVKHKKEKKQ